METACVTMTTQLLRFPLPDISPPKRSLTTFLSYSKQLEDFISKYKTRPPDIKFWPYGPYWPRYFTDEIIETPKHLWICPEYSEPFQNRKNDQNCPTVESQVTSYTSKWRGVLIVFDSERSSRDHFPSPVPEGCCPSLAFESRFECGNLRQARRVGQYEYELVLKTDLYTNRHTQWYYFRVQNAVPGITYRFRIVNLLKRDSLYNYGMRPLVYSEIDANNKKRGWVRTGHHISYSRNVIHLHCPLLMRGVSFHELEFQTEFPNDKDTCYLAHCYPYSFSDLKDDLETLLNDSQRQQFVKREVMCETRAGNSCFLVTVTNFAQPECEQKEKKAVVVTARVHPGESQASWMMKGVLEYISGPDPDAQELRNRFIFKIVPMLNPDGVIVGNYRCSLASRDLNRNYRHPRKESFPTVWHTKNVIDSILETHEVILYCDLHGHSRKHNVFMYGNNTATDDQESVNGVVGARAFLNERLFPWLMAQKSPEKFSFPYCKFNIKRCKEATGRVVMWRQFRLLNSFTLEATFSGTAMNKDECRHFNIADYMEMGQTLCQSVLEYQYTQENKARQTEIVLEMTRYLTCQILERRNRGPNYKMPNLRAFMKVNQDAAKNGVPGDNQEDASQDKNREYHEHVQSGSRNGAIMSSFENTMTNLVQEEKVKRSRDKKTDRGTPSSLSKPQVDSLLDSASMKTMDGCLQILAQLNVSEALEESDSSDSDSESEPEMKQMEPKVKKKKRKTKKQRDKELQERKGGSGGSDKKEERRQALPTISGMACQDPRNEDSRFRSQGMNGERGAKYSKEKPYQFISKYEGRKNGGIPCFAEERSVERAAKRMAEMKKRTEDDKPKDVAFLCVEDGECQCPSTGMPLLRRSLTNDDLHRRLQVAFNEGTSNVAQTLVGFNVKTGYTHADSFRDLTPSILPATAPQHNSSSDLSDSDNELNPNPIPVSARNNPYNHHEPVVTALSVATPHFLRKHSSLRGPGLRSMSRQHLSSSATQPLSYSHHAHHAHTIRAEVLPGSHDRRMEDRRLEDRRLDDRRLEDRARRDSHSRNVNAGPVIKGIKAHGQGE